MKKCFEDFEKEMKKAAKEAKKEREECIAEMENVRNHYIPEVVKTLMHISRAVSPYISSFDYCDSDLNGMIITAEKATVAIGNMQMAVRFAKEVVTTVEFYDGCDPITMLSKQIDLLKDISIYLGENLEAIMNSALLQYKNACNSANVDAKVQSVYHVAIAM